MLRINILFFITVIISMAGADSLLKTGQTLSYDSTGAIIYNGTIKDDGYYQKGATRHYSRNGNIIIDHITGLQWQDSADVTKRWISEENYTNNDYNNTSGDTAATYCSDLLLQTLDDWRLPDIEELKTIIDYANYPAFTQSVFQNITSSPYFSSTSFGNEAAWTVNFGDAISHYSFKTSSFNVMCVRGKTLAAPTFSRSSDGIVTDNKTQLQWQDTPAAGTTERDWSGALQYCEDLELAHQTDWRLPNNNELYSIIDRSQSPAIDTAIFQNAYLGYHWSSTSLKSNPSYAWMIHFYGNSTINVKTDIMHVFCVRGGTTGLNPALINYLLD